MADGAPAWSHKLSSGPIRSVGGTEETLFVGTPQGTLYAIGRRARARSQGGELGRKQHWENVFVTKAPTEVSWFQAEPTLSLRLLDAAGLHAGS